MFYYVVSKIGTGTKGDAFRPDIDPDISFVGHVGGDSHYVIATPVNLGPSLTLEELEEVCTIKGISFNEVRNMWFVR